MGSSQGVRVRRSVFAVVLGLLLVAGCTSTPGPKTTPRIPGSESEPTPTEPVIVGVIRQSLEEYWAKALPSVTQGVAYTPVQSWIPYRNAKLPTLTCGVAYSENAAYCPTDDSISYSVDWLSTLDNTYSRTKNMGTIVILAHEFGHHISDLHQRPFTMGIGRELQADCYSGVFLTKVSEGGYPLVLENGDAADGLRTLAGIADKPDFVWSNPTAHGGPNERRAAMGRGFISGDPQSCAAYEKSGPILVQRVGDYDLRLPPASIVTTLGNGTTRFTTVGETRFTTELSPVVSTTGTNPVDWLTNNLPSYFAGSTYSAVGNVENFNVPLANDAKAASLRYTQITSDGRTLHGLLILAGRSTGSALVIDTYTSGPAPSNFADWTPVGNYAFSTPWGLS